MCQNLRAQVNELQSQNENLKSKVVECTMCQNLQVQVEELKSVNENEKYFALKEIESLKDEIKSLQIENQDLKSREFELNNLEKVYETKESVLLKDIDQMKSQVSELVEKLKISAQEMKQQIVMFEEDKRMFLAKNEFLETMSSSVQKEYNDLLASNDVLKHRLEIKFKFLKQDTSLEKIIEMIEKEYESNVSKISITSSTFETKNLELVKEMGDKVKRFDDEKKEVFEETTFIETFASQNHEKTKVRDNRKRNREKFPKDLKYSRDEMFSMRKRDDSVLKKFSYIYAVVREERIREVVTSQCIILKKARRNNQSLLLQYSRDGYVIEGELKDYEDSCEKSSVQIKFKVEDFIQAIKESSCKRRSKLDFENADFEFKSRVDTFRDKEIYPVI
ncbi:hypothetical protein Tco_0515119 [Tanacetum coccineum]